MYLRLCVKKIRVIKAVTHILVKPFRSLLSPPAVYTKSVHRLLLLIAFLKNNISINLPVKSK